MHKSKHLNELRKKREYRIRKKVQGTNTCPRLSVHKSNKNIFVQLIDDESGCTLAAISTLGKEVAGTEHAKKCKDSAKKLGEAIAQKAEKLGIKRVNFDRGRFKYHGILAALADAARENGLQF